MRLAYVLERYPELSQTFVEDELRELERGGDGVEVLALEPGSRPELSDARFQPAYPPRGTERLAAVAELAARRPGDVARFLARPQPWPSDGRRVRGIARLAGWVGSARRSEHIHAHFATEAADVAALLGRLSGRPHSFTGHSTDLFADPAGLRRRLEAGGVRRARLRLRPPRGGGVGPGCRPARGGAAGR